MLAKHEIYTSSARLQHNKTHTLSFSSNPRISTMPKRIRTMMALINRTAPGAAPSTPDQYYFPPLGKALTDEDQNTNAVITNQPRPQRESNFCDRNWNINFGPRPFRLQPLPLPDPYLGGSDTGAAEERERGTEASRTKRSVKMNQNEALFDMEIWI
jgi:hypothetical protein